MKTHNDEKKNASASFEAKHLWVNAHKPVNMVIPFKSSFTLARPSPYG